MTPLAELTVDSRWQNRRTGRIAIVRSIRTAPNVVYYRYLAPEAAEGKRRARRSTRTSRMPRARFLERWSPLGESTSMELSR